jgi:uncharacterized RDD family membrane protein YckC
LTDLSYEILCSSCRAAIPSTAEDVYFPPMESSASQGTIGKIAFGLTVTDTSFRRISFGRAFGRYLAKIPSALILYLGFVMVGLTPQKRGLHDYIAGTLVLRR